MNTVTVILSKTAHEKVTRFELKHLNPIKRFIDGNKYKRDMLMEELFLEKRLDLYNKNLYQLALDEYKATYQLVQNGDYSALEAFHSISASMIEIINMVQDFMYPPAPNQVNIYERDKEVILINLDGIVSLPNSKINFVQNQLVQITHNNSPLNTVVYNQDNTSTQTINNITIQSSESETANEESFVSKRNKPQSNPLDSGNIHEYDYHKTVEKAFNDFYKKNNHAPSPDELCKFMQTAKEDDKLTYEDIVFIKIDKPLIVLNKSGIEKSIEYSTFENWISKLKNPK
jgi:hypothetical protein